IVGEGLAPPEAEPTPSPTPSPSPSPTPDSRATVAITVNSGDSSFTVCSRLEAAGLVEKASALDNYLVENGYNRKIQVGTREIPVGADFETIAQILTGPRR
ncbi:MAG: hypothetical protein LBI54_07585, partial [Lachnospiraceae bacterium]|nr:hypothetical protein [Lachnospiraceae bacterium]